MLSVHQKALLAGLWSIGAIYSLLAPTNTQQAGPYYRLFNKLKLLEKGKHLKCQALKSHHTGSWRFLFSKGGPWVTTGRCLCLCCSPPPPCTWTSSCCPPTHSCQVKSIIIGWPYEIENSKILPNHSTPICPLNFHISGAVATLPHVARVVLVVRSLSEVTPFALPSSPSSSSPPTLSTWSSLRSTSRRSATSCSSSC